MSLEHYWHHSNHTTRKLEIHAKNIVANNPVSFMIDKLPGRKGFTNATFSICLQYVNIIGFVVKTFFIATRSTVRPDSSAISSSSSELLVYSMPSSNPLNLYTHRKTRASRSSRFCYFNCSEGLTLLPLSHLVELVSCSD